MNNIMNNKKVFLFFIMLISFIEFIIALLSYNIYFILIYIISLISFLLITNNILISILIAIIFANIYYIITSLIEPLNEDKKKEDLNKQILNLIISKGKNITNGEHKDEINNRLKNLLEYTVKTK